jgi:hypothetical protein
MSSGNLLALDGSTQPNIAPAQPLRDAVESSPARQVPLDQWARGLRDQFRRLYQQTWDRKVLIAQKNELFYRGFQRLRKADYDNYWRVLDENPLHYTLNVFRFWSDLITSKWVASNPDYDIRPSQEYDSRSAGGAMYGETVIKHYERKFFTQTENIRQSKRAQNEGNLIWYFYYDPGAKVKARMPVVEDRSVQFGEDTGYCPQCGYAGPAAQFQGQPGSTDPLLGALGGGPPGADQGGPAPGGLPQPGAPGMQPGAEGAPGAPPPQGPQPGPQLGMPPGAVPPGQPAMPQPAQQCPGCGSSNVMIQESPPAQFQSVTGFKEVEVGDVAWRGVQIYNLHWDPTLSLADSPYLMWEEYYDRDTLAEIYPALKLPNTTAFPIGTDTGLTVKSSLEQHGTYRYGSSIDTPNRVLLTRIWLKPAKYCKYAPPDDVETADGTILPKDTKFGDQFPTGLYLALVGDLVVDIREEDKCRHFRAMGYHLNATGGLHDGIEDMLEPQRQRNVLKSQMNLWIRSSATPSGLFNPLLIDAENYTGDPDKMAAIKAENLGLMPNLSIGEAIHYPQPAPMNPAIFQYVQGLDSDLQLGAHTTDYSGGLPGVNNNTATGANITQALSASIHTLQLAQYADFRRDSADVILDLFRTYCPEERCYQIAGPNGQMEMKWFGGLDITDELIIDVVPDSWSPRTSQERAERMNQALLGVGGVQGLAVMKNQLPEMVSEFARIYDVDFGDAGYKTAMFVTRDRLDQLTQLLPQALQMAPMIPPFEIQNQPEIDPTTGQPTGGTIQVQVPVDPVQVMAQQMVGQVQPPVDPFELGHEDSIQELRTWLLLDEGRQAHPVLRKAVTMMIQAHVQGIQQEMQLGAMLQAAAQPPAPAGASQGPPAGANPPTPAKTPQQHRDASAKGNVGRQNHKGKGSGD